MNNDEKTSKSIDALSNQAILAKILSYSSAVPDGMLIELLSKHALVVFIKANDGYSVYLDDKQNYNILAEHFNAQTPIAALVKAFEDVSYQKGKKENDTTEKANQATSSESKGAAVVSAGAVRPAPKTVHANTRRAKGADSI